MTDAEREAAELLPDNLMFGRWDEQAVSEARLAVAAKLAERDATIAELRGQVAIQAEKLKDACAQDNEQRETIKSWKDWHRKLASILNVKYNERNVTLQVATDLRAQLTAAQGEIERLKAAINETLELADSLNEGASRGAGFAEHWGERVLQAVEPLRDTKAFANQTLAHNRSLLEHNGKLVDEVTALRAQLEQARGEIERLKVPDWVCELHPDTEWPHGECPGPGMPPSNWNRILVAREAEIADLRAQLEQTTLDLARIGDRAVADWDNATVGEVDKALAGKPKTYIEALRAEKRQAGDISWLNEQACSLQWTLWLGREVIWRVVAHDGRGQLGKGNTAWAAIEAARKERG